MSDDAEPVIVSCVTAVVLRCVFFTGVVVDGCQSFLPVSEQVNRFRGGELAARRRLGFVPAEPRLRRADGKKGPSAVPDSRTIVGIKPQFTSHSPPRFNAAKRGPSC